MPAPAARASVPVLCLALLGGTGRGQTPLLAPEVAEVEDATDSGLAFVELALARDTYVLGEPFELRLRFGFEPELLRANLVQLFQRPLDLPVQVFAPALESMDGLQFLDAQEPQAGTSFALGERVTRAARGADVPRAGRDYAVFEFTRRATATRVGELVLPAPLMRFAHATRFEDDFVQGRMPLDRRDLLVRGQGARLTILPLPEEGRPAEFTGAIGRFTLEVTAEPRELAAGQGFELRLVLQALGGPADLAHCEPPRLEGLAGFHVRGLLVEREERRLTARYDLVPTASGPLQVPPIGFASYDTTPPAGYRAVASQPVPILVHPVAERRPAPPAPGAARADARARLFRWAAALLAGLVLAWVLWRRAQSGRGPAP